MYADKVVGNNAVRLNLFRKLSDLNTERQQETLDRSIRKQQENSVIIFNPTSPTKASSPGSGPLLVPSADSTNANRGSDQVNPMAISPRMGSIVQRREAFADNNISSGGIFDGQE